MSGFKNFIMRGNLIELAVAVVIGTQFSNLVKQFVSSFVNPLLSLVGGTPDFGNLKLHVGQATFTYGQFLTVTLTFLISALVVYYAMVLPAGRPAAEAARAEQDRHDQGLPGVHDERPDRGHALPGMHGPDHARHRAAPAGRTAPVMFTRRIPGKLYRSTI